MSTFEEASQRYVAAEREFLAAALELRSLLLLRIASVTNSCHIDRRTRRTWQEASDMSIRVRRLREIHPEWTSRKISEELKITHEITRYYLSAKCKAPLRAADSASPAPASVAGG